MNLPSPIDAASKSQAGAPFTLMNGTVTHRFEGRITTLFRVELGPSGTMQKGLPETAKAPFEHCVLHLLPGTVMIDPSGKAEVAGTTGSTRIMLCDQMAPYHLRAGDERATILTVSLPRHTIGGALLAAVGNRVIFNLVTPFEQAMASFLEVFASGLAAGDAVRNDADLDRFGEALAALVRAGLQAKRHSLESGSLKEASQLERITRFIDQHLLSPELSPELIAGEFAMSRAALYRLFEPLDGVARYIRRQKMAFAAARLAEEGQSTRTLTTLARRLGFDSLQGFEKAFKSSMGRSLRDVSRR